MTKLRTVFCCCTVLIGVALGRPARAQQNQNQDTNQDMTNAPTWRENTVRALSDGTFLPLTLAPSIPAHIGQAVGYGGYDGARGSAIMESHAEVRIWGPLSLRGGAVFSDTTNRLRPSVGARLQFLSQVRHGVNSAVGVFYRPEGLTEPEGEIETVLSVGRQIDNKTIVANLAYGQDPEGNERDGEIRLAFLLQLGQRLNVGLDGRWRFDLGSNTAKLKASNEPTYDIDAGPVAAVAVGPVALMAHAGVSVVHRVASSATVGAIALGGIGSSF
jgi:hypothetical protein